MYLVNNPAWLDAFRLDYDRFEDIPDTVFGQINQNLDRHQRPNPLVSIVVPAYNEEINILRCVSSLAAMKTDTPFEIIVVNNNSTDKTGQTLDKLHVKSFFEARKGCGPTRQCGQEQALGKYILLADADCLYPDCWLDEMLKVLTKPGVVCVYGRYSFISEAGFPRWKLTMLETMKDIIAEFRHLKRPYFNSYGLSMGYVKEYGLKVGFVMFDFRGEDGKLCLDLMPYGKIKQVRANKARTWTGPRTLQRSGSFAQALGERLQKEVMRFFANFHSRLPADQNDPEFSKKGPI